MTGRGNRRIMIRAGRLWDDRVYGIARYGYGERTEMGGHVDGVDRVQDGKTRTSYL